VGAFATQATCCPPRSGRRLRDWLAAVQLDAMANRDTSRSWNSPYVPDDVGDTPLSAEALSGAKFRDSGL